MQFVIAFEKKLRRDFRTQRWDDDLSKTEGELRKANMAGSAARVVPTGGEEPPQIQMMKAIVLREYGDESKLNVSFSTPQPQPAPGHVVLRVRTCALSRLSDLPAREGLYDHFLELRSSSVSSSTTDSSSAARYAVLGYEVSGEIHSVGEGVTSADCTIGDEFIGICSIQSLLCGLAEYVMLPLFSIVRKPSILSHFQAAASILPSIIAYSSLHYRIHLSRGETVLIMNGADETGHLALQIASNCFGARVITTVSSMEQLNYLQDIRTPSLIRVVDLRSENLVDALLEETGGLGVNGIMDVLPRFNSPPSSSSSETSSEPTVIVINEPEPFSTASPARILPHLDIPLKDLILCLSAHATLVTNREDIVLDPVICGVLQKKSASLSFFTPHTWTTLPLQRGRLLHVLVDALQHVATENLVPKFQTFPVENIRQAHRSLGTCEVGRIVIKM